MFTVDVITAYTAMTPLQLRAAFRQIGLPQTPEPTYDMSADECFKFWIILLINRLKFLDSEQRNVLIEALCQAATGWTAQVMDLDHPLTPMVVLADSRYATWHDHTGWLDLKTGQLVKSPRVPPLETIGYNLAVLFNRNLDECKEIQQRRASDATGQPG